MNDHLGKIDAGASWFEAFIPAHPYVVAIVVAILISWALTAALKKPLRAVLPAAWQDWGIRTFDCLVALAIARRMWPGDHRELWALLIGFGSPSVYAIVAGVLVWKWPRIEKFLTLRELAASESPATGDETRLPPGDTQ